jgi:hypothetical protein
MMPEPPSGPKFAHRPNRDGSFDSICARCFRTISNSWNEADLDQAERDHVCSPGDVDRSVQCLSELPRKGVRKIVEFPSVKARKAG